jgi:copper transport protein
MIADLRLLILILILTLAPSLARAHAQLLSTEPAENAVLSTAPKTLTLRFNEPVSPLTLKLIGPDGRSTEVEPAGGADVTVPLPAYLIAGTYVLSWRVVSADGHPIGGAMVLSVVKVTGAARVVAGDP